METLAAATRILVDLRKIREQHPTNLPATPAMLWERAVHRAARSAAFRLLSKRGLIENAYPNSNGPKLWRATDKAMALRDGEEFSAIA